MGCLKFAHIDQEKPLLKCVWKSGEQQKSCVRMYDFHARMYMPDLGRTTTQDPLAEKNHVRSPYHFLSNNPINRIDPNGMDDYTINKKTGATELVKETDDKTDRVVKTYSMGKKKGQVKTYKRGKKKGQNKAESGLDNVEKGILSDGMNFKENDNLIEVGGEGQPSAGGVKSFTLGLSEYVGTEISGLSYSSNGSGDITDMVLGKYKYNDRTGAKPTTSTELYKKYGNKYTNNNIFEAFHTHPDGTLGATQSDPKISTDYGNLQRQKPYLPNASFIILYRVGGLMKTHDYTYLYNPKK